MTKLHKSISKALPKEARTPLDKKISEENISTHESLERRMNPAASMEGQDEPVIPMPDEDEIKRSKRRGTAARSGGRASTILTGGDQDRLGG